MTTLTRPRWTVPTALILLAFVPAVAGVVRVVDLAGGEVTADNSRFFASPLPVLLHVVGATVYSVVGAFQFVPGPRRSGWHRRAGRLLVPCGLVAALSGLWMTLFHELPAIDGDLLGFFRVGFGSFMAVALVLGFTAVRRRDYASHRAWMTRAYAIGLGAGSQAVVLGGWALVAAPPGEVGHALLMAAAWAVNLAVAEWVVRRRS
ncbi:DUF2306 domain-containing protein [Saccharothrix syringae]|uniref:DUF2306 domain-containing protein n=1 Tax=Saccharothrix syringae TaxID=103733 RepID=A0A5Q0H9U9_SACSY|nr:DUF2306 domain-containing protein [Saccharothrix syringae]QFZ23017.1 DUF2306 domain-containing protein [Saccharothrix syringae]